MEERQEITLREAQGSNPPGLLKRMVREISKAASTAGAAARDYIHARVELEKAKAAEIHARARREIAAIEHESLQLLSKREEQERAAKIEEKRDRMAYEAKMYAAQTDRLSAAVSAVEKLERLGVNVTLQVTEAMVDGLLEVDRKDPSE